MKNLPAIIFDLDGVLVDSKKYHQEAWSALGKTINIEVTEDFFIDSFGLPNSRIIPLLLKRSVTDSELSELAEIKETHYRAAIAGNISPLPGVLELLELLKNENWLIALGTSAPAKNVALILRELNIASYFKAISQEGDYTKGKPEPDVFLIAAKKLGSSPNSTIVVEDAVHGVIAAKSAGMKCVAVTTTTTANNLSKADLVVDSLAELNINTLTQLI